MSHTSSRQIIETLLKLMAMRKGSDLFLLAGSAPAIKIDGALQPQGEDKLTAGEIQDFAMALMSEREYERFGATKESNFAIALEGVGRFRVNAYVQMGSPAIVVRTIADSIPNFEDLKLPPVLAELAMTKRGLIIFVGGTGTGKSTSLAAFIDYRNTNSKGHILTIEDPVEYVHTHKGCVISHREVGADTDSWDAALKNALRQAPDVVLMGEIRDKETMEHALAFAETGHLCLATLHANSANQAIDRIVNFFSEERRPQLLNDLSMNLKAVVSQRLVPLKEHRGRAAAVEVLINSPLVADRIMKGEIGAIRDVMKKSVALGMQTFDEALYRLFAEGRISLEDSLRYAESANDLRLRLKLEGLLPEEAANQGEEKALELC